MADTPAVDNAHAEAFIEFVTASPSPFHAVQEVKTRLLAAGYVELRENDAWDLSATQKFFVTRNQSTVLAFDLPDGWNGETGFSIVAAHTDSPCLRVKPVSDSNKSGFVGVGVETYGGGIWHSWFDRDLSVAGRVIVAAGDGFEHRLVDVKRPLLHIPTLAIHLERSVNDAFKFNKEDQLWPILATAAKAALDGGEGEGEGEATIAGANHSPVLLKVLAEELGCEVEAIRDFELSLYDTCPPAIGGALNEFIFSARLDNLMSTFCGVTALTGAAPAEGATNARVGCFFDHEEVGSVSAYGAQSQFVESTLERVLAACLDAESPSTADQAMKLVTRKSMLISADMAHALHPNYASKHEANHRPALHEGPVIKYNSNQRYATTSETAFYIKEIARGRNIPVQEFVVRNDSPCGSTIGPSMSARLGMRTVDIGNPQLSMHSAREMCGTDDVTHCVNLLAAFYEDFPGLDAKLTVD